MKTSTWVAIAVIAGAPIAPAASQPAPADLQPSLAFARTVSKPMPDFRGVPFYVAMPDSQGRVVATIGHSDVVKGWFSQMEPVASRFRAIDDRLGTDVGVYGDTVREEGGKVLAAAGTNLKASLQRMDRERVLAILTSYNDEVRATRTARQKFDAATKHAEEAAYLVDASDAGARECNALLERSKLEAERSAVRARMDSDMALLNAVEAAIKAIGGGVDGVTDYLVSNTREAAKAVLVDAFNQGARDTLYEIDAKIRAIDASLADVRCKQQNATLKAAKANLQARLIEVLVPLGGILDHRAKAWAIVDRLAALQEPGRGRPLPFFEQLKTYNAQVNTMGRTVFDSINAYLEFLSKTPVSRGPLVANFVKEDLDTVQRDRAKRDPRGEWLDRAQQTAAYLQTYSSWYDGELARGQRILADLREGRHLDFVDRMVARATRDLGGTVSYEEIIR